MEVQNLKGETGVLGEALAARYLQEKGCRIIGKNYRKPWGEIDIIARKGDTLHFVEVKAGSVSPFVLDGGTDGVYRPEENVHKTKVRRLIRTIHSYLEEEKPRCKAWQLDVVVVLFNRETKRAKVRTIQDVLA
jgi:putative endonuclease